MAKQEMPSKYLVCVRLPKSAHSNPDKLYRVGHCNEKSEIESLIREDLRSMNDTIGGLIPATSTKGRVYEVFEAKWTKIKI